MPCPDVKLTVRLPQTENAMAPPCAECSPSVSQASLLPPKTFSLPSAYESW
jgi:hypothetical protein